MKKFLSYYLSLVMGVTMIFCLGCKVNGCEFISFSCTSETIYYDYDKMVGKIVKIDVITTKSTGQKTYLKTLDSDLVDDFLYDLSKIKFQTYWIFSNKVNPQGVCFLLYYNDGSTDIIDEEAATNKPARCNEAFCDKYEFQALINKYYL